MEALMNTLATDEFEAHLLGLGERLAAGFQSAKPFPHVFIDDFLPADVARAAAEVFPPPGSGVWERFEGKNERKLALYRAEGMPPPLRDIFYYLNAAPTLRFLEKMTGIGGLLGDPYFFGGGLHQTERGGRLGVHVDFNRIPQMNLNRRLNLLIYLNDDWREEYGGHLELWNADMTKCVERIAPIFNRCVVFSTVPGSFHGQPVPLTCPEGRTRKSLATYYYTAGTEGANPEWHSTLFQARPGDPDAPKRPSRLKTTIKRCLPPILLDALKRMKN